MLKLTHLTNMEKFLSVIDKCAGSVLLYLENGEVCDLKTDSAVRSFLRGIRSADGDYRFRIAETEDLRLLLQFIYEEKLA